MQERHSKCGQNLTEASNGVARRIESKPNFVAERHS